MIINVPMNIDPDLLDEQIEFLAGFETARDDNEYQLVEGILGILEALFDQVENIRQAEDENRRLAKHEADYDMSNGR